MPTLDLGHTLLTAVGPVEVTEECGGIRSLHLVLMASLFWAGFFRMRLGRGLLFVVSGLATAVLINIGRMALLGASAVWTQQITTIDKLHDSAAIGTQLALMLAVPALGWLISRKRQDAILTEVEEAIPGPLPLPRRVPLPAFAAVAAVAWLFLVEAGAEGWFRLHERKADTAYSPSTHWIVKRDAVIPGLKNTPLTSAIRENYRFSDSASLEWRDEQKALWKCFWLDFDQGANFRLYSQHP